MALPEGDSLTTKSSDLVQPVTYLEAAESLVPVPYIAAQFPASDFSKYSNFVLGDGKVYPISSENLKTHVGMKKYFNGPLSPNTRYTMVQKFYSKGVCSWYKNIFK